MAKKTSVLEYFDKNLSEEYPLFGFEKKIIRGAFGDVRGKKAVDVGCGTGNYLHLFSGCKEVYGLDFSPERVREAAKKNKGLKNLRTLVGDAASVPFEDNYFDFVFSRGVIQHIPSASARAKAFKELYRILKPRGKLVFGFDNRFRIESGDVRGWSYFIKKYSPFDVVRILKKEGFKIKAVYGLDYEILPLKKLGIRTASLNKALHKAPLFRYFGHKVLIYAEK